MALLDDVKVVLRVSNTAFDTEINDLIEAAKVNLDLAGVLDDNIVITDPIIKQYIITYVKAHFGWDNPDAKRLQDSVDMQERRLHLAKEYAYFVIAFEVEDNTSTSIRAKVTLDGIEADTDEGGNVSFYSRNKNNIEYTVTADGYESETDVIDIDASKTISVTLQEV